VEEISKSELEQLYYNNTNKKICQILGISKTTLIEMIDKAGIKKKGKGYPRKWRII
jgi:hypothetical protein